MEWMKNEKSALAREAGILQHRLAAYAKGKALGGRDPSGNTAKRLEEASLKVLGPVRQIPAAAWMHFEDHPMLANYFTKERER